MKLISTLGLLIFVVLFSRECWALSSGDYLFSQVLPSKNLVYVLPKNRGFGTSPYLNLKPALKNIKITNNEELYVCCFRNHPLKKLNAKCSTCSGLSDEPVQIGFFSNLNGSLNLIDSFVINGTQFINYLLPGWISVFNDRLKKIIVVSFLAEKTFF